MEQQPSWDAIDAEQWQQRVLEAQAIGERWAYPGPSPEQAARHEASVMSIDFRAYVGARHHTVPRFLLERWADANGQVRVYHRVERSHTTEHVKNLAIKDFYTVIDRDGLKNSVMETLMGRIEGTAIPHLNAILNPYTPPPAMSTQAVFDLAQFAAFQSVRTARYRREYELRAEWFAKASAAGQMADDELQKYTIAPHQNEAISFAGESAEKLIPFFLCRPLAVIHLDKPLLYTCDEPVVLNSAAGAFHTADCALTDDEVEARVQRKLRKMKKKRRDRLRELPGRVLHFTSTRPVGHGVAEEMLLAISPSTALLWGPLQPEPPGGPVEYDRLTEDDAVRFAYMANEAMCAQALDWIVSRQADAEFAARTFPEPGPLMKVCDGTNAASLAINATPRRMRPHRLWMPDPEETADFEPS